MSEASSEEKKLSGLILEITDRGENLSLWETQFVESVSDQLGRGRSLSERQRFIITRIYQERVLGW